MDGDNQKPSEPQTFEPQAPAPPEARFYARPQHTPEKPAPEPVPLVTWTASEYVSHEKTPLWYGAVLLAMAVLVAIAFVLTHDYISIGGVLIIGVLFIIMAGRKPRILNYALDNQGITIGARFYAYSAFKSYGLVDEGAFSSIALLPMQRFMPSLSVYCSPDDQEKILGVLGQHLPFNNNAHDALDSLVRHMRF